MLYLNKFFGTDQVVAFTTGREYDFTLTNATEHDLDEQRGWIRQASSGKIQRIHWLTQVHGGQVRVIDNVSRNETGAGEGDALITNLTGEALAVRTADCLPVFMYDEAHQAIGLVHAGWKGLKENVVRAAYWKMQEVYQSDYEDLLIVIGPSIRKCCFQVGNEFLEHFPESVETTDGGYVLDLQKVLREQLFDIGLNREQIFDCRICTGCQDRYFSHRREKDRAGRMLSVIMLMGANK